MWIVWSLVLLLSDTHGIQINCGNAFNCMKVSIGEFDLCMKFRCCMILSFIKHEFGSGGKNVT